MDVDGRPRYRTGVIPNRMSGLSWWRLAMRWAGLALAVVSIAVATARAVGAVADEVAVDDDFNVLPAGLMAEYHGGSNFAGPPRRRIDADIAFDWGRASPDPRVPAGLFSVRWRGRLFVRIPGTYHFHLFQAGRSRLSIGPMSLDADNPSAGWTKSDAIELDFGYQTLTLEYRTSEVGGRVGLYWSGPGFELEPVPGRVLFHDKTPTGVTQSARGHDLVRAYRCDHCHSIRSDGRSAPAPALTHIKGTLEPAWLRNWLASPTKVLAHARMPDFALADDEVDAIAAYLTARSETFNPPRPGRKKGDAASGERLFVSRGCLACHTIDSIGTEGSFSGGDLSRVATKRSPATLRRWLSDPAAINVDHRMPTFKLSREEIEHLVVYLSGLGDRPATNNDRRRSVVNEALVERGRRLIADAKCSACHRIPDFAAQATYAKPLHGRRSIDWAQSCVGEPERRTSRPGYRLDEDDRRAIRAYIEELPAEPFTPSPFARGADLMRRRNCLACHPRGLSSGLVETAGEVSERHDELLGLSESLVPPALTSVGDKLLRPYLEQAVGGDVPRRLAWLKVDMPRFNHAPEERAAIVDYLIAHDRIPSTAIDADSPSPDAGAQLVAGQDLVGRGFSCTACHRVGPYEPKDLALATRGSDLVGLGRRMRRSWFHRWMHGPLRITPGVEMPAYTDAAPGILDSRLDPQLDAMWTALNDPAFVAPTMAGVVEQDLVVPPDGAAAIVRDVFANGPTDAGWTARGLAVGLNNRHNILIDLETFSVRKWWYGDFARQRTRGKTWFWESAGTTLFLADSPAPSLAVERDGRLQFPVRERQTVGWLTNWQRGNDGRDVSLRYELRFPHGLRLDVTETISPTLETADEQRTGWRHSIRVRGLPAGAGALWLHRGDGMQPDPADPRVATFDTPVGRGRLRRESATNTPSSRTGWRRLSDGRVPADTLAAALLIDAATGEGSGSVTWTIGLHLEAPPPVPVEPLPRVPESLDVLDGFDVVRLPLEDHIMPTGLDWRPDGTLVICSLRGDILLARDTDGDGMEDTLSQFADHLAAPFGVLVDGDDILVSHKPEVLRLIDGDGDGRAERSEVLGTGWGFTDNYHDWTVGLVRDAARNLYVVLGSDYQQNGRLPETTRYRGHALRIAPDGAVTSIASGLRFACGIAMNADGAIFVSDNQGEQNPFNEINHLIEGGFYGVPGLYDPRPTPESQPVSVQVRHPATRSVNGLVFVPLDSRQFREFAGHGLGCEYDLKALIRFSVQKVGDTYQGATYPFTRPMRSYDRSLRSRTEPQGLMGTMTAAFSPAGDLYVGTFLDSGWLGGTNRGAVVRIRRVGPIPTGIREVRAVSDGFTIEFTHPISAGRAADPNQYTVSAYRRIWKGGYATPDRDRHAPRIEHIVVADDARSVRIVLAKMEPGFVYDVAVKAISTDGKPLWPASAHYTLNVVPR